MNGHLTTPNSLHHAPRKSPSRQSVSLKRSSTSLKLESTDTLRGISLAHELAAALMPEPSAGSRLLSEEFGIEFDEGAEGIEETSEEEGPIQVNESHSLAHQPSISSLSSSNSTLGDIHGIPGRGERRTRSRSASIGTDNQISTHQVDDFEAVFGIGGSSSSQMAQPERVKEDPLKLLSDNLQATDIFITQLRQLDSEQQHSSNGTTRPMLETVAADVIGRINDTVRERESQVRVLSEYEREFRKIAGEVGGNDVLGDLEELDSVELVDWRVHDGALEDDHAAAQQTPKSSRRGVSDGHDNWTPRRNRRGRLQQLVEEEEEEEYLADDDLLGDHMGGMDESDEMDQFQVPSPSNFRSQEDVPPPPPMPDVITSSSTLPHLANLRSVIQSLTLSLTSISEHAQVNGAATADAGRRIRALKNKYGQWRADWESAERSRWKIDKWEAGLIDDLTAVDDEDDENIPGLSFSSSSRETSPNPGTPDLPAAPMTSRRIDGRKLVEEQLQGFQLALEEAGLKTKAIMAST
ncbi:hypothetical protein FRC03_008941 [Tulasnella sp. 419]|nr:hypothetical protein FRC03_008941 [Tulasnella sp. 419]